MYRQKINNTDLCRNLEKKLELLILTHVFAELPHSRLMVTTGGRQGVDDDVSVGEVKQLILTQAGAGAEVTASGLFADIIRAANQ